jgi:hypothetical protein
MLDGVEERNHDNSGLGGFSLYGVRVSGKDGSGSSAALLVVAYIMLVVGSRLADSSEVSGATGLLVEASVISGSETRLSDSRSEPLSFIGVRVWTSVVRPVPVPLPLVRTGTEGSCEVRAWPGTVVGTGMLVEEGPVDGAGPLVAVSLGTSGGDKKASCLPHFHSMTPDEPRAPAASMVAAHVSLLSPAIKYAARPPAAPTTATVFQSMHASLLFWEGSVSVPAIAIKQAGQVIPTF